MCYLILGTPLCPYGIAYCRAYGLFFVLIIHSSLGSGSHASVLERVAESQFVPGRCDCQKSSASLKTLLKRSTHSITLAWHPGGMGVQKGSPPMQRKDSCFLT